MSSVSRACAGGSQVGGFRAPAIVRSEVMVRLGAVGRLRRTACMLIVAACAAIVALAGLAALEAARDLHALVEVAQAGQ